MLAVWAAQAGRRAQPKAGNARHGRTAVSLFRPGIDRENQLLREELFAEIRNFCHFFY
jgi:hypothetical protein